MGKRIAIKTTLICCGIFLIINVLVFAWVFTKYPLDTEKHISVIVAAVDIDPGITIEEKHLKKKEIQLSASNPLLETDISTVIGKKTPIKVFRNDYIRSRELVSKDNWFRPDDRIIILPMSIEERLANLIKKGSYIDIRLKQEISASIETILKKVRVEDVLDEAGTSLDSKAAMNSRTSYLKLVLNEEERLKIYTARDKGKLIYELYCDEYQ